MKLRKRWMAAALAAAMAMGMSIPSYAEDRDKISSVKFKVVVEEPVAGEDVEDLSDSSIIPSNDRYIVIPDSVEYYNTRNDDVWERGEIPVIRFELELKEPDKWRFYSTSSSKFSVSGSHATFKSAKVQDNGNSIRIDVKLRAVSGDIEDIEEYYWDGRTAVWSDLDDADKYEIKLYRNGSTVTTVTSTKNEFNFYPYMTRSGEYSFKVRAISNSDGEKSAWTDESEDYYMNASDVYTGAPPVNGSTGSNSWGGSIGSTGWVQDIAGWRYGQSDGTPVRSAWLYVDNNWFYFDANGYMMTGWIFVDNNWFYLNPISDGTRGAMKTGWQNIDGFIYYLNPVSDGTRGARKTSYQFIDGKWYFFDVNGGFLWANMTVPNGRWAGPDGVVY